MSRHQRAPAPRTGPVSMSARNSTTGTLRNGEKFYHVPPLLPHHQGHSRSRYQEEEIRQGGWEIKFSAQCIERNCPLIGICCNPGDCKVVTRIPTSDPEGVVVTRRQKNADDGELIAGQLKQIEGGG